MEQLNELLIRLAEGDKTAFEPLYEKTKKTVYYVALSIIKDKHLAEDIMQVTYLNVIRHADKYKKDTNPKAWIARIAKNEAINQKKKRDREVAVDERENPLIFGSFEMDDYNSIIEIAKELLPNDEFSILMLITAEGYKRREIAKMLSMPIATVSWKYSKALKTLKNALSTEGGRRTK